MIVIGTNDRGEPRGIPEDKTNNGIFIKGAPDSGKNNLIVNIAAQLPPMAWLVLISKMTLTFFHLMWQLAPQPRRLISLIPSTPTCVYNPVDDWKRMFAGYEPGWPLVIGQT